MQEPWKDVSFPLPVSWGEENRDRIVKVRQNYAAMVENIDRNCGLLIDEVRKRGELENTIIIYSSDHGETLGDHLKFNKSQPERASVDIPFVMWGPGIERGAVCDSLVELQDLTNTIMDLAGLEMPEAEDSLSLVPILRGEKTGHREYQVSALLSGEKTENREYQVSALTGWQMINDGRYKLIVADDEQNRLYDLDQDPWETNNIAEEKPDDVRRLKAQLNEAYKG